MEIVNLSDVEKTSQKLYNKVEEKIDNITGEITTTVNSFLQKVNTKDDFIKLFTENISFLVSDLSGSALKVLLLIIRNINYQNIFQYNSEFVNYFESKKILGKSSVYNAMNELEKKNVILKITKEQREEFGVLGAKSFIINPNIIGKGSFRDLKELRQTVTKTFNFDKLEIKQETQIEAKYKGMDEILNNPENYNIIEASQIHNKDRNLIHNMIVVEEKQEKVNNQLSLFDENEQEHKARLFVEKFGGMFSGVFHPTKSAKEMKRELLDQDLKEGRI
ncbi:MULTISPECIES: hypothetical protein [Campylobacter]|uniref:Plasmid replication protein RepL domain-containing protein n=1 Tax=Campylobacter vicugnae TaxID=1660076 RepID=A0A1X9T3M5_9BACT|nr:MULTISPECIES: hypothetical protein [unclassified Campylobacter]ARR03147.1 hypothetical protein CVIC8964_a0003 [Campylobacter sp. RM8964]ARR04747.1 hypothetical protein CVIC12175_a0003 [Campylobacter sp. RM12175]MCR8690830.1 hypothetical protein [Campylobacter sp. RM9264]MCR8701938.1 hypothetical protein [Campylobacter sp. RM12176]